jgi:putative heme transporter
MRGKRNLVGIVVGVAAAAAAGWFLLPKLSELGHTWTRVSSGRPGWLLLAVGLEVLSFAGYVGLFRAVFVRSGSRIGWRESYEITMAGLAATRLLAAGGAGGVALTAWALKRSGMDGRTVARRMTSFLVILYGVYMGALVLFGVGLAVGLFPGSAPVGVTLVPAGFGALVIVAALSLSRLRGVTGVARTESERPIVRRARWLAHSVAAGVRGAIGLLRSREPGLVGALAWWAFDIGVLWSSFHAFGATPPIAAIVMAYFVGTLANALPLPGGIGGVDGGMIGAFLAFGVEPGAAVIAVLTYRAIAFWLPTLPGAIAYLQLRRTMGEWRAEQESAEPAVAHARIAAA